jgi:hypothetical protein
MSNKRNRGRGVDATGRSKGGSHHVRLHDWELRSAAYRSLSIGARALLVELKALYFGNNNGMLFLSAREAARRLGCSKNLPVKLFRELQGRGFIRPNVAGHFRVKGGPATSWILTEFPIGNAKGAGTRDFMYWQPPPDAPTKRPTRKNHFPVPLNGHCVPPEGTLAFKPRPSVPPEGTVLPVRVDSRSLAEVHR